MLDNVGYAYYRLGVYDQAQSLLERAYDLKKRSNSGDRLGLATSAFCLATVYRMQGEFKRAEPFFREALAIRQQMLGPDAAKVVEVLDGLGQCLHDESRDTEAESVLRSSLEIARKQKIDKGDDVRDYLAQVLERRGDSAGAEQYARQALEMRRKLGGNEHPDVATSLIEVAVTREVQRDPAGAEALLREAFEIRKKKLYAGHPDTAAAEVRLGEALAEEGKASEAEPRLRDASTTLSREPFPMQSWQLADANTQLGICLRKLGRVREGGTLVKVDLPGLGSYPEPAMRRRLLHLASLSFLHP